jgi:hypothetical protein
VQPAEFFVDFAENQPAFFMKIFDGSVTPGDHAMAVLSFTYAARPSMTVPCVLPRHLFQNRDLLVLEKALLRPTFEIAKLRQGPAPSVSPGPIIFANEGIFIRAWQGQSTLDADLQSGAAMAASDYKETIWVEDWKIVLLGEKDEIVLYERGKPASP